MYAPLPLRVISRAGVTRCPVVARCNVSGRQVWHRFQSSTTGPSSSSEGSSSSGSSSSQGTSSPSASSTPTARASPWDPAFAARPPLPKGSYDSSHIIAGVAGGTIALLFGYAWYYFSGAKQVVDTSKAASKYFQETKAKLTRQAPKSPNELLDSLRGVAHSYLVIIPGARPHVDAAFDTLDELQDTHRDEMNRILSDGYGEMQVIIRDAASMDAQTAMKVLDVLRRRTEELETLGKRAGTDAFSSLGVKYPQISEKLGSRYEEFKRLANAKGTEAKRVCKETRRQLNDIFANGFSQDAFRKARQLIGSKTSELRRLARSSSQDEWDKALREAQPHIDKYPGLRQLLNENAEVFVTAGATPFSGNNSTTQELFAHIKDAVQGDGAKNQDKINELREFVQRKAREAEEEGGQQFERGWESMQDWVRGMPGGEEALERIPDVNVFVKVSRDRSEEAKGLAKETLEDVMRVLEEKAKKAKRLSEGGKEDHVKQKSE